MMASTDMWHAPQGIDRVDRFGHLRGSSVVGEGKRLGRAAADETVKRTQASHLLDLSGEIGIHGGKAAKGGLAVEFENAAPGQSQDDDCLADGVQVREAEEEVVVVALGKFVGCELGAEVRDFRGYVGVGRRAR